VTGNAALAVIRGARNKESPAVLLLAGLRQLLQVKHLTKRHSPEGQDILVEHVALHSGPGLEGGSITCDGGKITVVQPVNHGFFLLDAGPALCIVWTQSMGPESCCSSLIRRSGIVGVDEARPDEEKVTNLYVTPLGCRADVYALRFPSCLEIGEGDLMSFVRI
jgi:hypothetical protein